MFKIEMFQWFDESSITKISTNPKIVKYLSSLFKVPQWKWIAFVNSYDIYSDQGLVRLANLGKEHSFKFNLI